jgi:4-hydroxy-3-polyprenylbenzoate decarboxylase
MKKNAYDGLRSFLGACEELDEVQHITGADWNLEINTLSEAVAEHLREPKMLLFDEVKDYPAGYRVMALPLAGRRRVALALGLDPEKPKMQLLREASRHMRDANPVAPQEVETGPVMENIQRGNEVDLLKFPVPLAHEQDGGRYIGTADSIINRDPDSGYINMATYRIQVHGPNLLGLWMSPGQQGRAICQSYWDKGESCPIVATFGGDPLLFMVSSTKLPWGRSEMDYAGGLMGHPLEVIPGPLTGLPIPAHAEIAIEGEVPPPTEEAHEEGPFGEWPGYYSGGTKGTGELQPVIRVNAVYHRDDPILVNMAPQWPGAPNKSFRFDSGLLWDQLEAAGIPGIEGVFVYHPYLVAVAIKQSYAGHAKQTGLGVLAASATARNGRYIVVVDDDIDPSNIQEVLWAMETRVDPASDIEIIDDCWGTPLDPRMPPEKREAKEHTNSRAIFYALRPYAWRDKYPEVNRANRDTMRKVMTKYRDIFAFPDL